MLFQWLNNSSNFICNNTSAKSQYWRYKCRSMQFAYCLMRMCINLVVFFSVCVHAYLLKGKMGNSLGDKCIRSYLWLQPKSTKCSIGTEYTMGLPLSPIILGYFWTGTGSFCNLKQPQRCSELFQLSVSPKRVGKHWPESASWCGANCFLLLSVYIKRGSLL